MAAFVFSENIATFESMKQVGYIVTSIIISYLLVAISLYGPTQIATKPTPSPFVPRKARIAAVGDLMQHIAQLNAARQADSTYDYHQSFKHVAPLLHGADLAIINLETTLSHEGPYSGYPTFCSPATLAKSIAEQMGIDVVALANNHCCDRGRQGIKRTTDILEEYRIPHIGAYADSTDYKKNRICHLKRQGISFAIVNYTYGTNGIPIPKGSVVNLLDSIQMATDIASIDRDFVDCIIAVVHWGNEYERHPNLEQRTLADFLKRQGVDIILGSHPHVVQPFEVDSLGRITVYSMGNFVSNQRKRYSNGGIMATIDIEECEPNRFRYTLDITPLWVKLPHYTILPPEMAKSETFSEAEQIEYKTFIADTEELLGIEVK